MIEPVNYTGNTVKDYEMFLKQLDSLIEDEVDSIALLSNVSALLNQFLDNVNWVGFYLWKKDELVLGPFQGLPACSRIGYGKGVCGTAVKERKTQRVDNVLEFPGHIFCDSASQSELVIPIFVHGEIYGVLDIDSPIKSRFSQMDQQYLEKAISKLEKILKQV